METDRSLNIRRWFILFVVANILDTGTTLISYYRDRENLGGEVNILIIALAGWIGMPAGVLLIKSLVIFLFFLVARYSLRGKGISGELGSTFLAAGTIITLIVVINNILYLARYSS